MEACGTGPATQDRCRTLSRLRRVGMGRRVGAGDRWGRTRPSHQPFDRLNYCAFIGPAMSHLLNGRNDEAANAGRRAVHSNPGFSSCHAAALAELGRVDEAESVAAHILVLQPSFSTHGFCAALALPTTLANRLAEAWRAAGGGDRQQIRRRKGRISVFCGVRTAAVPARRIPRGKRLAGTLLTRMSRSN